jgi:hypothetical protein
MKPHPHWIQVRICSGRFRKHDAKQNFNCHRTPTLNHSKADVIVVMKRKNCETGNEELIALQGVYNKLVSLQSLE